MTFYSLNTAIPGLLYVPMFIDNLKEKAIILHIDRQQWIAELKRRVQHYGYKYDYKARNITKELKLGSIPDWLAFYCNDLYQKGIFSKIPDQVIVNEYLPGQGISQHIDCTSCFEEKIASLSIGSACVMDFVNSKTNNRISMLLEPCSLIVLSGDARYQWKHGIASRKKDSLIPRDRRLSLTFRNVILS